MIHVIVDGQATPSPSHLRPVDQYEPGVYEVSPYIVKKIADLK